MAEECWALGRVQVRDRRQAAHQGRTRAVVPDRGQAQVGYQE